MKRFMLAVCAGLLAAAVATPSFAADMPRPAFKAPLRNPVYVAPFSWTGFYVGINGGYGFGKTNWVVPGTGVATGDFDVKGPLVGGTVGYNLQTGSWVWGVEGDFDASWIKGSNTTACGGTGCETKNTWFATGRGRIGYAWEAFLPYLTGGAAFGNIKAGQTGSATTASATKVGWTVGAGIEYALFKNEWSVKLEYLYADLGKFSCDAISCGGAITDVSLKTSIVRLGVNYRF
jgi:outer membrane immunogenic protein